MVVGSDAAGLFPERAEIGWGMLRTDVAPTEIYEDESCGWGLVRQLHTLCCI